MIIDLLVTMALGISFVAVLARALWTIHDDDPLNYFAPPTRGDRLGFALKRDKYGFNFEHYEDEHFDPLAMMIDRKTHPSDRDLTLSDFEEINQLLESLGDK